MAPSNSFDYYYHQTLGNVRFFSREDVEISIITAKEPLGKFKSMVLRAEGKHREVLLSETGSTLPESLQLLHTKSAEAVQNHITTYGYDFVRDFKKRPGKKNKKKLDSSDDDSDLSDASDDSSLTLSDIVSNDSLSSDDDDDKLSIVSTDIKGRKRSSKSRKTKTSRRTRRSRSRSPALVDSDGDIRDPRRRSNPSPIHYIQQPMQPMYARPGPARRGPNAPPPPPPPPGWGPPAAASGPPPPPGMRFPAGAAPMPSAAPSQPPMLRSTPPPAPQQQQQQQQQRDVRLHITWPGHGDQRVIEHAQPSRRALADAALSYVRNHAAGFAGVTPLDASPGRLWGMKATLRQACFGGDSYDMSAYPGEDLTRLFDAVGDRDIPLFEVEVAFPPPPPPPGPMGMGGPRLRGPVA